ncbi:MAG: type II toxin-antitoxin system VapC family toxin [Deltaproteobacteria bacterium]|nr:type II toxin-antitoxin system VapC family toxin [Deltaproteobacteria bacterium]
MVLDTSALIALLLGEREAPTFRAALEADVVRLVSAANLLESAMVIETRLGEQGGRELDLLIQVAELEVVPVDSAQVAAARQAFRRFGKGRHPPGLNFGDCFAYALAVTTGEPLLFKGSDFAATDVLRVV